MLGATGAPPGERARCSRPSRFQDPVTTQRTRAPGVRPIPGSGRQVLPPREGRRSPGAGGVCPDKSGENTHSEQQERVRKPAASRRDAGTVSRDGTVNGERLTSVYSQWRQQVTLSKRSLRPHQVERGGAGGAVCHPRGISFLWGQQRLRPRPLTPRLPRVPFHWEPTGRFRPRRPAALGPACPPRARGGGCWVTVTVPPGHSLPRRRSPPSG